MAESASKIISLGVSASMEVPLGSIVSSPDEPAANVISLAEELVSANRVQRSMLPRQYPALKGWDVAGFCLAAGPVGGDFYDIQQLACGRTLFVVADVMGKGIPAALIASVMRTVMRGVSLHTNEPSQLLSRVNELIYEDLSAADMFVTLQAACLDPLEMTLTVANAGHCPLLMRTTHGYVEGVCPAGIPIGVAPRATYAEEAFDLSEIEYMLLYTDGIVEATNPKGEVFGAANLERWLEGLARLGTERSSAETLKQELLARIKGFESGLKPKDDQTLVLIQSSRK